MSNALELSMREVARELYNDQLAFIFKVPEEWTQTPCDFFGHTRIGQAVMIECKQVKRTSLPKHDSPGLAPHQFTALKQASLCGVHTFVIWQNGESISAMTFPQLELHSEGRKSIAWKDAAERFVVGDLLDYFRHCFR